ncbi:MAG: phosphoribosyl-AMP cyclohydrolase [Kiritimatiellae bacterium]|nr:phosphoribosyl-AMP cyclohydrolase [Kiritimatiellia bacterium]
MTHGELEEGSALALDFGKLDSVRGVVPVAVQDAASRDVILVAYTNEAAMRESFRKRRLVLWSTSRGELWEKGATSGCTFELVAAYVNCEQNSLLYVVRPHPPGSAHGICHTRDSSGAYRPGCFYRRIDLDTLELRNERP